MDFYKEIEQNPDQPSMPFELPEVGLKAIEDLEKEKKAMARALAEEAGEVLEPEPEELEEEKKREGPVESVQDMARILELQATKTHGQMPERPQQKEADKEDDSLKGKMIVGISGVYAGGAPPRKPGREPAEAKKSKEKKEKPLPKPAEFKELLDFLEESIDQYKKYVDNIGRNGLAAVNLGYYRDDVQDMLDLMKYEEKVDLRPYWEKIVKIDMTLRAKTSMYVREVGHENFKQYQVINDPPHVRWWWYLNRITPPPVAEAKFWGIWRK